MYKDNLIEITQDAACVIENNKGQSKGFFTDNIQTCLVYIFKTKNTTIGIHDSGQLRIEELTSFVLKYGEIISVDIISGPDLNQLNKTRQPILLRSIGYTKEPKLHKSDYKIFSAACELNGGISIFKNTTPDNVYRIPNKSVIQTIVELNNNFIPLNSQSLPLDIQFENGIYCNNSKLLFSLEEMLNTFKEQPQFRDINLMFLRKGHAAGLFSLPRILLQ